MATNNIKQGLINSINCLSQIHDNFTKTSNLIAEFQEYVGFYLDHIVDPVNYSCLEEAECYLLDIISQYKDNILSYLLQCERLLRDVVKRIFNDMEEAKESGELKEKNHEVLNVEEMRAVLLAEKITFLDNKIKDLEMLLEKREDEIGAAECNEIVSQFI